MKEKKMMVEEKKKKEGTKRKKRKNQRGGGEGREEKEGESFWNLKEGWVGGWKEKKKPTSMFGLV